MATEGERYAHKIVADRYVLRNLYRRGATWYFRARDLWTDEIFTRSCQTGNRQKAEAFAIRQLEERVRLARGAETEEVLFREAFSEWLETKTVRPITLKAYKQDLKGVYAPVFGDRIVSHIAPVDVQQWIRDLAVQRKSSTRTRKRHLGQLRSFFRWCRDVRKIVRDDPTAGLRVGRGEKVRPGVALTREEVRKLLVAASTPVIVSKEALRNAGGRKGGALTRETSEWEQRAPRSSALPLALLISFHSGLRRRNVFELQWWQVEFSKRRIFVKGSDMKAHVDHYVPIHRELEEVLRERTKDANGLSDYVLGRRYSRMDRRLESAVSRAGIERISWHGTRHTFSTLYARNGTRFEVIQALLGHTPPGVTWDYLHPPFEDLLEAVDAFPPFLTDDERAAWLTAR